MPSIARTVAAVALATLCACQSLLAQQAAAPSPVGRWFEPQIINLAARYRGLDASAGTDTNDLQDSITLRGMFKLDPAGRVAVTAGVATGNALGSGWNNTGLGSGAFGGTLSVKQLYLGVSPVRGVGLEYGGVYAVRGETTEVTNLDNDTYLTGGRLSIRRSDALWLDEITVTLAYLGDTSTPNAFSRFRRLPEVNYRQYLIAKKIGKRVGLSAEYDRFARSGTYRGGLVTRLPESRALDLVRLEFYHRQAATGGNGFAIAGEKSLAPWFLATGGFATIDPRNPIVNGDRYLRGKRLYTLCTAKVARDVSLLFFLTRAVTSPFPMPNKTRAEVVLAYNPLPTVRRVLGLR